MDTPPLVQGPHAGPDPAALLELVPTELERLNPEPAAGTVDRRRRAPTLSQGHARVRRGQEDQRSQRHIVGDTIERLLVVMVSAAWPRTAAVVAGSSSACTVRSPRCANLCRRRLPRTADRDRQERLDIVVEVVKKPGDQQGRAALPRAPSPSAPPPGRGTVRRSAASHERQPDKPTPNEPELGELPARPPPTADRPGHQRPVALLDGLHQVSRLPRPERASAPISGDLPVAVNPHRRRRTTQITPDPADTATTNINRRVLSPSAALHAPSATNSTTQSGPIQAHDVHQAARDRSLRNAQIAANT